MVYFKWVQPFIATISNWMNFIFYNPKKIIFLHLFFSALDGYNTKENPGVCNDIF